MKKRLLFIFLAFLLTFGLFCGIKFSRADSGFDSSWDSGGSWDSDSSWDLGSSWDSGSSWDWDWDSSQDSSNSRSSHSRPNNSSSNSVLNNIFFIISVVYAIVFLYLFIRIISRFLRKRNYQLSGSKSLVTDESIQQLFNMTRDELKVCLFDIYKNIQIAWMNFDYDSLKKLTTNELYNQYKMQLDTMQVKSQKNVMKDILLCNCNFNSIKLENGIITINCFMFVNMIDYLEENGKAVRGSNSRPIFIAYEMNFIVNKTSHKCSSCGADVTHEVDICPYCKNKLIKSSDKIVLAKKKNIYQK